MASAGFCLWVRWDREAAAERQRAALLALDSASSGQCLRDLHVLGNTLSAPAGSERTDQSGAVSGRCARTASGVIAPPSDQCATDSVVACSDPPLTPVPDKAQAAEDSDAESSEDCVVVSSRHGRRQQQLGQRRCSNESWPQGGARQSRTAKRGRANTGSGASERQAPAGQWRKRRKKAKW